MVGRWIPGGFDASGHDVYAVGISVCRGELSQIVVSRKNGIGRAHNVAETGQAAVAYLLLRRETVTPKKGVVEVVDKAFCIPAQNG